MNRHFPAVCIRVGVMLLFLSSCTSAWAQSGTRRPRVAPQQPSAPALPKAEGEKPQKQAPKADAKADAAKKEQKDAAPEPAPELPAPTIDPELIGKFVQTRPALALEGFDPVALQSTEQLQQGKPQFEFMFDSQTYRFLNDENLNQFKEDPATFVPALGGLSVVAYRDSKQAVPGNVQHYSNFSSRIYLFASSDEKAKFDANPGTYFDADVLMDGLSPVSLVEKEVLSRGDKEFMTIYDGRRVYLVSETEQEKFAIDPARYYPTLGGLDPVATLKGEPALGIPRYSVVYKNRLYMMSSDDNRREFLVNPLPYSDLDVALGGNCPVTLVDEKREQKGHYGISVISRGRRLLFANDQKREQFNENIKRYDKE